MKNEKIKNTKTSGTKRNMGFRILADGITVSNDTWITGMNNNDIIYGGTGSGKTTGYVEPNIRNINGSMIVSDTKGRLCKKYTGELEKKGYEVKVLDLVNPHLSCPYNPLSQIRRYKGGGFREQDVLTCAQSLVADIADADEPIWHMSARSYITFLICYCLEEMPEEEQNLTTICELNHAFSRANGELPFVHWVKYHPKSFAAKKYREIKANMPAEKMWSSILGFANVALEPFEFHESEYIFGKSESIDLKELGRKKMVLFLNVSDTDRTFDPLVNIFYTQALQNLCAEADERPDGRLRVPVRIIMDDFATSARIRDFDKIISVIRSREISVSLILQSMAQLKNMYGEAANTIIDNCDHTLFLGTQNLETAEFIGTRAYKTPEKILCMPADSAYLLEKGKEARLVKKILPA